MMIPSKPRCEENKNCDCLYVCKYQLTDAEAVKEMKDHDDDRRHTALPQPVEYPYPASCNVASPWPKEPPTVPGMTEGKPKYCGRNWCACKNSSPAERESCVYYNRLLDDCAKLPQSELMQNAEKAAERVAEMPTLKQMYLQSIVDRGSYPAPQVKGKTAFDVAAAITTDRQARKEMPVVRGLLDYFPLAALAVANCSFIGNEQHNPGEPMHWAREKSTDQVDCAVRHLMERGKRDTDGVRHSTKAAWRCLASLQLEIEADGGEI